MNITCNKEELLKSISLLSQIIPSKPQSRPVLSNVLMIAKDESLILVATDMEMGINVSMAMIHCYENGEILLPAHQLLSILREASTDEIRIEVLERTAILSGRSFQYKLPAYANEEFPEVPQLEGETIKVNRDSMHRLIKEVAFAMNRDRNRYQLNSILLALYGETMETVATDQVRLAFSNAELEEKIEGERKLVFPAKSIPIITNILSDEKEDGVELVLGDSQLTVKFSRGFFIVRLVEAQFPNYRNAYDSYVSIPDISIPTQSISQAIRQVILLTCENAKNIALILEKGRMTFKASTPLGEGKVELDVDYQGEDMTVGMNPQFVQDFLKEVSSQSIETIRLKIVGPKKPIIMSPHDHYIYFMSPTSV